jgi:hypothetical protein
MDKRQSPVKIRLMTAIRVIFDGKTFIPQQPVSLPDQSKAPACDEQDIALWQERA